MMRENPTADTSVVIDQFPAMLAALDEHGIFKVWNQECVAVTGYSKEYVMGKKNMSEVLFPQAENRSQILEFITKKEDYSHEIAPLEITCFDGSIKYIRLILRRRALPVLDGLHIWAIGFDQTVKFELARDLEISDQRFRTISKGTNDAVWEWNIKEERLWWGEGMTALFGHPEGGNETDFDWWVDKLHPEDRERVLHSLMSASQRGDELWSSEYRFRRPDGTYAFVLDKGVSIFDDEGKVKSMIGGMVDITAKRVYEQSLIVKNQQLAEFAFFNSHKVRAPLTTLLSCVALLNSDELVESERKQLLEGVLNSANELDRQIHEINLLISTDSRYDFIRNKK
ncbi:MAG: PAS domain-containing protein [Bacteroidia bacterium]